MPRARVPGVTWETVVDGLVALQTRHIIRKPPNRGPYIFIADKKTKKLSSLKPLRWEIIEDVKQAAKICEWCKDESFPKHLSIDVILGKAEADEEVNADGVIYDWDQVMDLLDDHLTKYMKATSAKNVRADIKNLRNKNTPFIWKKIRAWLFEKDISSRPFKNRLDSLEQLRLAIFRKFGDEPEWLLRQDLMSLRTEHNASNKQTKRYQAGSDQSVVRAIPTKKEAESYLDALDEQYKLHRWCLAMMMCYGMRNHELWHCALLEESPDHPGYKKAFLMIPGDWRTKSKFTHWTFPIFPDWIAKYKLIKDFSIMQEQLHKRAKPKIVSSKDRTVLWKPGNSRDMGICMNNDYLGNWVTKQLKERLPEWKGTVPNAKGQILKSGEKETIKPYDLRHSWAIHLATSPKWQHVTDNDAALAMGHSVDVHRKSYQRWISEEDSRESFLKRVFDVPWYKE